MSVRLLLRAGALLLLFALSACSAPTPPGAPQPTSAPAAEPAPPPPDRVIADASVVPERVVDVAFAQAGTVAEVLVREGDAVAAGAPLARLDTHDLELQVAQSRASLAQAQASYDRIAGGATAQQIAAQRAVVQNAEAGLRRARTGGYTAADIARAQAQVRQAEAALAALRSPSPADLSAAEERARQAEVDLQATRDSASQAKTSSQLAMQRAADALTQAQAAYATAAENWQYVDDTGADPANPTVVDAAGKTKKNLLNDVQKRQYYQAFVQAEAALHSAEKALADAQVVYRQAQNHEIAAVQGAESRLAEAQARLAGLKNPDANALAQAQASLDQARAAEQSVRAGGAPADVDAAQATLAQQRAALDQLTAPPRAADLAEAQGRVAAAQAGLQQAERALDQATLRAPFGGTIAARTLEVGQRVSPAGAAPLVLADLAKWNIVTDNLSERDVVRIAVGSPAQLSFDALPGVALAGTVAAIQPRGVDRYGDITYTVTVAPSAWDARLRWNMSASVSIAAGAP